MHRLIRIDHPTGNPVNISWAPNERKVQRGSYLETTKFDAYGRKTSVTLAGGSTGPINQTFTFDPLDRQIFTSYPNQSTGLSLSTIRLEMRVDAAGRHILTTRIKFLDWPRNGV